MAAITSRSYHITWLEEDVGTFVHSGWWEMGLGMCLNVSHNLLSNGALVLLRACENLSKLLILYHRCDCDDRSQWKTHFLKDLQQCFSKNILFDRITRMSNHRHVGSRHIFIELCGPKHDCLDVPWDILNMYHVIKADVSYTSPTSYAICFI